MLGRLHRRIRSSESRLIVEKLSPDDLALLARPLSHQDDAGRLERLGGRGDGEKEPEPLVDVERDDDVVHAQGVGLRPGTVAQKVTAAPRGSGPRD